MGKKRIERIAQAKKKQIRNITIGIIISLCVVALIAVWVVFSQPETVNTVSITPDTNGDLRIPLNSLQNRLNYVEYGGTEELLVWKDESGVRTAFDTCEDCYANGSVHFTLSEEILTCTMCGSTQAVAVLGTAEWGGCKPVAILPDMRDDTDTEVVLSAAVLSYAEDMFSHWDGDDYSVSFAAYGTDEAHTHE